MAAEVLQGEGNAPAFPFWVASRRKFEPHDPFFAAGNIERELLAKHVALDLDGDEKYEVHNMEDIDGQILFCPIVGCGARLKSLEDFEDHYHARHTASCSVCWRVYPTSRLLSIHVSEAHDSFFQAKVARGFPMYECLVEGCGLKLKSYQSRQQHLVDKHKFPSSFEFLKKAHPSKHRRQKYQHKPTGSQRQDGTHVEMDVEGKSSKKGVYRSKGKQPSHKGWERKKIEMDVEASMSEDELHKYQQKQANNNEKDVKVTEMEVDEKVSVLISAVSKLSTSDSTPSSINFGHRHNRAFTFLPRSVQRNKKLANAADTNG